MNQGKIQTNLLGAKIRVVRSIEGMGILDFSGEVDEVSASQNHPDVFFLHFKKDGWLKFKKSDQILWEI